MSGVIDSLVLRPLRTRDVPRILKDWLVSYHTATEVREIPNGVYYHWHHKLLESLMEDPEVVWLVAVPAESPDLIAGWLCASQFAGGSMLLHYVYVTRNYRRLGLGQRLIATAGVPAGQGVMTTALTFTGKALLKSRGNTAAFNPYLLMGRSPIPAPPTEVRADIRKELTKSRKTMRFGVNLNEEPGERT